MVTFSMFPPTTMVSKIHLPQEVGLNFSNVPIGDSPLHYSILLEPPPECSSFLEWAGYARGCNFKLHKCLTFYKERVVARQEYFSWEITTLGKSSCGHGGLSAPQLRSGSKRGLSSKKNKSKWWLWGMIGQLHDHRFLWICQRERIVHLRDLSFPSFWLRREPLGEVVGPRPLLFSKAEWLESATIGDAIVASGQSVTRASLERNRTTRWLLQIILLWRKYTGSQSFDLCKII